LPNLINRFDESKPGNFKLQMYVTSACGTEEKEVRNWASSPILSPNIVGPDSEPGPENFTYDFKQTKNTFSFKIYNNSRITHAVHYEVTKVGDQVVLPTIDSPNLVVDPRQFSSIVTIEDLEEDTTYRLDIAISFLGEIVFTITRNIKTSASILNPDPSTINQDIVSWPRASLELGDLFRINAHSSVGDFSFDFPNSRNYCNTYYFQNTATTTVENIANHILERGWLRRRTETENSFTFQGWSITGDRLNAITNIALSDSNTYNGLIDLANSLNMNVLFNYNSSRVIFVDRESNALDKNYTLRRGSTIQDYGISYDGNDMYTVFYVQGGLDEFGLTTILSDSTPYKDNFLYNFDYFQSKGLANSAAIKSQFETRTENSLVTINELLQDLIREEADRLGIISVNRARFRALSDAILGAGENTNVDYSDLNKLFKDIKLISSIETKALTPVFTEKWSKANSNYKFDLSFPVKIEYDDEEQIFATDGATHTVAGVLLTLTLIPPVEEPDIDEFEYTKNGLTIYGRHADDPSTFDSEKFEVISSKIQYKINVIFETTDEVSPYLDDLFRYDGQRSITDERARLQNEVDQIQERWNERFEYQQCLSTILYNGEPLEEVDIENINPTDLLSDELIVSSAWDNEKSFCALNFSLPRFVVEAKTILEAYPAEVEDFQKVIGNYNPETGEFDPNELGIFNFMLKKFDRALENYVPATSLDPVLPRLRSAKLRKQQFWYDLKKDRQHIFVEGYFDNEIETTPQTLKDQAEAIFIEHQNPNENFNITQINISDVVGVEVQEVQVGDFVRIRDERLPVPISSESKLKVASINKILRDDANITLTIYRYNLINRILERIIQASGN